MRFLILLSMFVTPAFAAGLGGEAGGGGKVVVCKNHAGKIASVELLDLWEARKIYSRKVEPVTGDLSAAVDAELVRMKNAYPYQMVSGEQETFLEDLRGHASSFLVWDNRIKRLRGVKLTLTDDSYEVARPDNCEIEQLVNYQDNGFIYIDQDLWDKMDKTNLAAAIVHEAFYALLRVRAKEPNSIRVRRTVGLVASGCVFELNSIAHPWNSALHFVDDHSQPSLELGDMITMFAHAPEGNMTTFDIYVDYLDGTTFIGTAPGIPPATLTINTEIAREVITGHCAERDGVLLPTWMGFTLIGDVEYDHQIKLALVCSHGNMGLMVSNHAPGTPATPLEPMVSLVNANK